MRFDASLHRMPGEGLIGLTSTPEFIFDPGTYFGRSTSVMKLPGALIEDFQCKLQPPDRGPCPCRELRPL